MRAAQEVSASFRVEHPNPYILDQLDGAGLVEAFGLNGYERPRPAGQPPETGGGR